MPTLTASAFPAYADLNFSNRPVRTRMPGGVGGVRSLLAGPYPDFPYNCTLASPTPSKRATTVSQGCACRMPHQVPVVTTLPAGSTWPPCVACCSQAGNTKAGSPSECVPRNSCAGAWPI